MEYKPGDKVKIKKEIWEELSIDEPYPYKMFPNRILTIKGTEDGSKVIEPGLVRRRGWHYAQEFKWSFPDSYIDCLVEQYEKPILIKNRFEIMDFD